MEAFLIPFLRGKGGKSGIADFPKDNRENFTAWLKEKLGDEEAQSVLSTLSEVDHCAHFFHFPPLLSLSSVEELGDLFKRIATDLFGVLDQYRDFLKEKTREGEPKPEPPTETAKPIVIQDNWVRYDLKNAQTFRETWPAYCSVAGREIKGKNWRDILVAICDLFIKEKKPGLEMLYLESLWGNKKRPFFLADSTSLRSNDSRQLSNGCWINVGYTIPYLMIIIAAFCRYSGVADDQIVLYGVKKEDAPQAPNNGDTLQGNGVNEVNQLGLFSPGFSEELLAAAETIIASNFVNGMRKNAASARKKFKDAYAEAVGEELSDDVDIDELVSAAGIEYASKVYAISRTSRQKIRDIVEAAVKNGNRVMFYEEIYQKNLDFMIEAGIFSSELLKTVLERALPEMKYKKTSFSPEDDDSLERDMLACYGSNIAMNYEEIKECLPYADLYQIRCVCSYSDRFVWSKEKNYALTDRIEFSQVDVDLALETVSQDISRQGFSMLQKISVSESVDLNPLVSESAIREAMFIKHLAPRYEIKRSVITLPGASFHLQDAMAEYCRERCEITLSELQAYEESLCDKSIYALAVACDVMIRVDKEHFVSPDAVRFDIPATDDALSLFVQDNVVPLGSVKSFTSFPEVEGYSWNLFLLNSFCRHKSAKFRVMGGPAKSNPVGAIFPSHMQFASYNDLLVQVAAKSGAELRDDEVNAFLSNTLTPSAG